MDRPASKVLAESRGPEGEDALVAGQGPAGVSGRRLLAGQLVDGGLGLVFGRELEAKLGDPPEDQGRESPFRCYYPAGRRTAGREGPCCPQTRARSFI